MRKNVPITEVRRNFGIFHDLALGAPVPVSKHGHESVYIVSARTFQKMIDALDYAGVDTDFLRPSSDLLPCIRSMQASSN
jgi:hypothetical protein